MPRTATTHHASRLLAIAVFVFLLITPTPQTATLAAEPLKMDLDNLIKDHVALLLNGTAARTGAFVTTQGKPAKAGTTATLQADASALTVVFTCVDEAIKKSDLPRDHPDLWTDDGVEIFLDIGHEHSFHSKWVHILLTASGQVMDESGPVTGFFTSGQPEGGDPAFNVKGLVTEVKEIKGGWTGRMVIPWASVGVEPKAGVVVGFNLNRTDHPDEYQCLYPTRGPFLAPDRWGHIVLVDPALSAAKVEPIAADAVAADHARVLAKGKEEAAERDRYRAAAVDPNTPMVRINGVVYGAEPDELGPIGGGDGYTKTFTRGDIEASTIAQLIAALKAAKPGQVVFIPGRAVIDVTEMVYTDKLVLEIPAGVTLASDRGVNGSPGATLCSDAFQTSPMLRAAGPDVTVTGLQLRGPDTSVRREHHDRSFPKNKPEKSGYYYSFPTSDGIVTTHDRLTVANCDISGWSHGGVYLTKGTGHHVHHCHIHHNRRDGLGYGVSLDTAQALIERNVFEHNRHDIAGSGRPGSGYEACHNIVLFHQAVSHHFDMHGGRDRQDGTDIAGEYLLIHHNAFYGTMRPIRIRGKPTGKADIHLNWFPRHRPPLLPQDNFGYDFDLPVQTGGNTEIHDNAYGLISVK
ncbi:MAG: right-handed parallel beta-helix repeat-containing protein [Planctomycetes bacterium]|nr:right-handed parallel beta-helix repeat-containing protein [Planctomycetota bacterium]